MNKEERIESFRKFMEQALPEYQVRDLQKELDNLGFFDKPASIKHHGSETGGLYHHSMVMAQSLVHLTSALNLHWKRPESPYLIGMLHDICKCYLYVPSSTSPTGWDYAKDMIIPGHGDLSVIMAQKLISLTYEEIVCIRWHMGAFDDKENWKYYTYSVGVFPNVLYTHTSDMIASQIQKI